jgi:hypothetical protein
MSTPMPVSAQFPAFVLKWQAGDCPMERSGFEMQRLISVDAGFKLTDKLRIIRSGLVQGFIRH